MIQKEELARKLIARGLTERQICTQLNCSRTFLRRVRNDMKQSQEATEAKVADVFDVAS
jgi:transcriptional regulator with XRE-family HTH domain